MATLGESASLRQPERRTALMYVNDRNEREVLLDPSRLMGLTVAHSISVPWLRRRLLVSRGG
jgi:hypothetical protein